MINFLFKLNLKLSIKNNNYTGDNILNLIFIEKKFI